MSVSQHPVALQLERRVGGAARLLATVMALPLIDGIFVALLLAGTLDSTVGMLETGLLIFGGSATVAVILAEMDDSPREMVASILLIGAVLVPLAAVEAVFALTIESILDMAVFQRFAGLVILTIAAKTASSKVGEWLPSPAVIIALGLVASLQPNGLVVELLIDPALIGRAAATAAIGVAFALAVAVTAPQLRGNVCIDRFRFGSSVALGVLALPILGVLETDAPIALAVLVVTALFAYDPDAGPVEAETVFDDRDDAAAGAVEQGASSSVGGAAPIGEGGSPSVVDDGPRGSQHPPEAVVLSADGDRGGGGSEPDAGAVADIGSAPDGEPAGDVDVTAGSEEVPIDGGDVGYGYPGEDGSRAPWL